jgi:hypothetical protein
LFALVLASCTSSSDEAPDREPTSQSESAALITSLPDDCEGFGHARRPGEVTFAQGSRLFAATPNGSRVRCIGAYEEGTEGNWGGLGDRLFLRSSTGGTVLFSNKTFQVTPNDTHPMAYGLSRPTGTSTLFTSGDKRRLYKVSANGKEQEDISFLRRHDEVIYHPAGMHIAAVGVDHDGTYGIHIATNTGKDPHLLVLSEDAKRVYSLSFSTIGELFYVAEHDDHYDVHSVSLEGDPSGDVETGGGLATYYTSDRPITKAFVSQFRFSPIAIQVGTTEGNSCPSETVVSKGTNIISIGTDTGASTEPVGWLPNGDLAYVSLTGDCDTNQGVHIWDGDEERLLLDGPSAVAVRGLMPDPPDPPTKEPEVVA